MGLSTLPPLKAVRVPSLVVQHHHHHHHHPHHHPHPHHHHHHHHQKKKTMTSRHHYLLRMKKEESLRMRRLGSGLLENDVLDSAILTHLVSLLDSQRGSPFILGSEEVPDTDGSGRVSDRSLLSKRPSLAIPGARPLPGRQTSRSTWTTSEGRGEFPEEAPLTMSRDLSTASSCCSDAPSVPQLPPIHRGHPLSPIKDVSRETSQLLSLPALRKEGGGEEGRAPSVHVMPATPQHSTLAELPPLHYHHHSLTDNDPACMSEASGYNLSSDSSVTADPSLIFGQRSGRRSKTKTKASARQYGRKSQAVSPTESPPLRGSMVMAPDGEIIHVGGSIAPRDFSSQLRDDDDGGVMTDDSGMSEEEGEGWRGTGRGRKPRSKKAGAANQRKDKRGGPSVTEQDIVDTLTEQAKLIADALLTKDGSGVELERDIREAADLWMESHPARDPTQPRAVQDALKSGALDELMAVYRDSTADPTAAHYLHLIRHSLTTAVAKAAGLNPDEIPEDLEISPDLLEALASQRLTPDDVTIVYDEDSGRPVIRSRQGLARPGAEDGHHPVFPPVAQDLGTDVGGASLMASKHANRSSEADAAANEASPDTEHGLKAFCPVEQLATRKGVETVGLPVTIPKGTADGQQPDKTTKPAGDAAVLGI
ncbi:uncharacterized protein LOC143291868 [Babylonia areolata]|uniref:uncharacterized protein LOC143291868 n=1 Tax=Babylonia areolata TaxID=304850 RepID=UPI003FD01E14